MHITTGVLLVNKIDGKVPPAHDRYLFNLDYLVRYDKVVAADTDKVTMEWVGVQGEEQLEFEVDTTGAAVAMDEVGAVWLDIPACKFDVLAINGDTSKAGSKVVSNVVYIVDRDIVGGQNEADVYAIERKGGGKKIITHYLVDVSTVTLQDQLLRTNNGFGDAQIKIIEIGAWNMDTDVVKIVTHDLDGSKIIHVGGYVLEDSGAIPYRYPIPFMSNAGEPQLWVNFWVNDTIYLRILTSGVFDDFVFSSALINRGFLAITYIP